MAFKDVGDKIDQAAQDIKTNMGTGNVSWKSWAIIGTLIFVALVILVKFCG